MFIEYFKHIMTRHKTIWCPSKNVEDGVSLRFFSLDLSRKKAVLLRGGPLWKGLGGIITYTSPSYPLLLPWSFLRFPASFDWLLLLVAVVLLLGQRYYRGHPR